MSGSRPAAAQALRLSAAAAVPVPAAAPTNPCLIPGECPPPTATTGNLLSNANFETVINCRCPQPRNMANTATTKVCSWTDANNTRSDVYAACATGSPNAQVYYYAVPNNFEGTQAPRSGNAYLGFMAYGVYRDGLNQPVIERRSYATTALTAPLLPNRTYYAEYYVSLAEKARLRVASLGFGLSNYYPGENTPALLTAAVFPVNDYAATLTDRAGWQPVRGFFQASGTETYFTIGCFDPSPNPAQVPGATANPFGDPAWDHAYYYADDALLAVVPQVVDRNFQLVCGASRALTIDGLALPASAGATYRWTSSADPAFAATSLALTVAPPATTTYTLTVTLPGLQPPVVSQVTVFVNCCYTAQTPNIVSLSGTLFSGSFQFVAGQRYFVSGNLVLTGSGRNPTFTVPAGCTLNVAAGARIDVTAATTLALAGGTLTAACGQMWDGVYVQDGANFSTQAGGSPARNAEISYATAGVVLTGGSPAAFAVAGTNFLHNYESLRLQNPTRTGTVSTCFFDSDPAAFFPPFAEVSATKYTVALRHVSVANATGAVPNAVPVVLSNIHVAAGHVRGLGRAGGGGPGAAGQSVRQRIRGRGLHQRRLCRPGGNEREHLSAPHAGPQHRQPAPTRPSLRPGPRRRPAGSLRGAGPGGGRVPAQRQPVSRRGRARCQRRPPAHVPARRLQRQRGHALHVGRQLFGQLLQRPLRRNAPAPESQQQHHRQHFFAVRGGPAPGRGGHWQRRPGHYTPSAVQHVSNGQPRVVLGQ